MKFSTALFSCVAMTMCSGAFGETWTLTESSSPACVVEGNCIKSHAGAGSDQYANDEVCKFTANVAGGLDVTVFDTESGYDYLYVGNSPWTGFTGPDAVLVEAGTEVEWNTDASFTYLGFEICLRQATSQSNSFWSVEHFGDECLIEGRCIKSHAGAGVTDYLNNENCGFTAMKEGTLEVRVWEVEAGWDFLTIGGSDFTGDDVADGPHDEEVSAGTSVVWDTDTIYTRKGFEICYKVSGGGMGDPHFLTWDNQWFDFHGICDLALLQAPDFNNGAGLNIHIRTKARYEYSFIEAVAIGMGDDILEISSFGQYSLNGVANVDMPPMIGGSYDVTHTQVDEKKHSFEITLDATRGEAIVVTTFKDMVSVTVANATTASFATSHGLMGSFPEGAHLARDGVTVMDDNDAFGQEWQILASEPLLFKTPSIYTGQACVPPSPKKESRRLGESLAMEAAEKACAAYEGVKKDMCVFDVMAMGDLEVADVHGAF